MKKDWKYHLGMIVGMQGIYAAGWITREIAHSDKPLWLMILGAILLGAVAAAGTCLIASVAADKAREKWLALITSYEELTKSLRAIALEAKQELWKMQERERRILEQSEARWAERQMEKDDGVQC